MKKLLFTLSVCLLMVSTVFAGTQFIITTSLDKESMPVDDLKEIPFEKDHEYLMFVYKDDNTAFGVTKVYMEINIYDEKAGKYVYETLYSVDTETNWGYCYKGITFNMPMKLKIKVFTDNGELATKYIDVVE